MWGLMKGWFEGDAPVQIPDLDTLHADLTGLKYSYDCNTRLRLGVRHGLFSGPHPPTGPAPAGLSYLSSPTAQCTRRRVTTES